MKTNIKLWLFFGFIFLFGASLSAGLCFAYEIRLFRDVAFLACGSLAFSDYVLICCQFLQPFLLMFLASFTLFACAVNGTACLVMGMMLGQIAMGYCLSPLTAFTHAAVLVFILGYGALFAVLSSLTAQYRSTLKNAAPDLKRIARDPKAFSLLYSFLAICLIALILTAALYLFIYYFPL